MKKLFGWDVTTTQSGAERDAKQCLSEAMQETGLPEAAFEVSIEPSPDHPDVCGWVVELASDE